LLGCAHRFSAHVRPTAGRGRFGERGAPVRFPTESAVYFRFSRRLYSPLITQGSPASSLSQRMNYHAKRIFIPRAYDFFDLFVFLHIQPVVFQGPRQSRHPACPGVPWERSASQIYHNQRALWRGVEGPRRCWLADALGSFRPQTTTEDKVTNSDHSEAEVEGPAVFSPYSDSFFSNVSPRHSG
jgi:hypothetical protein